MGNVCPEGFILEFVYFVDNYCRNDGFLALEFGYFSLRLLFQLFCFSQKMCQKEPSINRRWRFQYRSSARILSSLFFIS